LGTTGRGRDTEISTYIENLTYSELSANIVDLCPVGALTNMPYAFKARPWELRSQDTVDIFDPIMPQIQVDSRGAEIMRILPRINEEVNEEWISDKTRHAFDGVKRQRLNVPMKRGKDNAYEDLSWDEALNQCGEIISQTKPQDMCIMIGQNADVESIVSVRDLFLRLGCENINFKWVNSCYIEWIETRSFIKIKLFNELKDSRSRRRRFVVIGGNKPKIGSSCFQC
jgi:NADH dehydrogenase (ubiquinone) Fe-S protein 1